MNNDEFLKELLKRIGNNLGNVGDNSHVNQGGKQTIHYNNIGKLKREPRNVRVHAMRNYFLYYIILAMTIAISIVLLMIFVGYYIDNKFLEDNGIALIIILVSSLMVGNIVSIIFFEKVFKKVKWGYVLYKNKTIVYRLKREKFYDDIWDIELKETWQGHGRLRYFGVTKETDKPYSRVITLMNYAQAKYIYDSFWSTERMGKFK